MTMARRVGVRRAEDMPASNCAAAGRRNCGMGRFPLKLFQRVSIRQGCVGLRASGNPVYPATARKSGRSRTPSSPQLTVPILARLGTTWGTKHRRWPHAAVAQGPRKRARRRASRRLLQRRGRRCGDGVAIGRARAGARQSPRPGGPGIGLRHHPVAGRHRADQQSRGGRRHIHRAVPCGRPAGAGAHSRPRPRYGHRRAARGGPRQPAGGHARQLQAGPAGPGGDRHRQPVRLRIDRDGRHRQRRRPVAARPERPPDRRRDPDRRGAQPRQLGRAAGQLARRGDRRQHGRHHGGAGHLLLGGRPTPPSMC